MSCNLLKAAIKRHIAETKPLIDQLYDETIHSKPVVDGRATGEIILHMIRSMEYYTMGLAKGI
ncbi:MAG: hypothetical protein ACTSP4_17145 [Candidatus Hodarchaeales archaeon]